jgi:peptide/nickel transport system permease protein
MRQYLAYRAVTSLVVMFGVSVVTYGLVFLTPGNPAEVILNERLDRPPSEEEIAAFEAESGLNEPSMVQYLD